MRVVEFDESREPTVLHLADIGKPSFDDNAVVGMPAVASLNRGGLLRRGGNRPTPTAVKTRTEERNA